MLLSKKYILLIVIFIAFLFGICTYFIFATVISQIMGYVSAFITLSFILIAGYHLSNYLFFRYYRNLIDSEAYKEQIMFVNLLNFEFNYSAQYLINELEAYFKLHKTSLEALEFIETDSVFVLGQKHSLLDWDDLIICNIHSNENKSSRLCLQFNCKQSLDLKNMIEYLQELDIINFHDRLN